MTTEFARTSDLRQLLLDLLSIGIRQADIARQLEVSRACISSAYKKKRGEAWMPSYAVGVRLVEMHQTLFRRSVGSMVKASTSASHKPISADDDVRE